jgi:hypothetical protein
MDGALVAGVKWWLVVGGWWLGTTITAAEPLALGVYWAGEYCDPAAVAPHLDGMRRQGVNTLWLTHRSAAETAAIARQAESRGIRLLASCAELAGEVPHVRVGDHAALIARTRAAWGDAPAPWAWGLGDEPRLDYRNEMRAYAAVWGDDPVATVVMHGDRRAYSAMDWSILAQDVYPFFAPGSPHGYGMDPRLAWIRTTRCLVAECGPRTAPWMMGQGFQEVAGPWTLTAAGTVALLPEASSHWVMPTPAQMRWQAWSAVALGARGVVMFHYRNPTPGVAAPAGAELRDTGAPTALVAVDGTPSAQYRALGEAYRGIAAVSADLVGAHPTADLHAWAVNPDPGTVITAWSADAKPLLCVVNSDSGADSLELELAPHVAALRQRGGPARFVPDARQRVRLPLVQGAGMLLAVEPRPGFRHRSRLMTFSGDQPLADASGQQRIQVLPPSNARVGGVSAADGGASFDEAWITFDLVGLLGAAPSAANPARFLYDGDCNPADYRGVRFQQSDDGTTWTTISQNRFGHAERLTARHLRAGLSWRQAGDPGYGNLHTLQMALSIPP